MNFVEHLVLVDSEESAAVAGNIIEMIDGESLENLQEIEIAILKILEKNIWKIRKKSVGANTNYITPTFFLFSFLMKPIYLNQDQKGYTIQL